MERNHFLDQPIRNLYFANEKLLSVHIRPARQCIRSTAPWPHPQGWSGGRSNSTLVTGKLRGPEARMLYGTVQVGTAGNSVPDHSRCVRPAVCEWIEGASGVPGQFFKATDAVAYAPIENWREHVQLHSVQSKIEK